MVHLAKVLFVCFTITSSSASESPNIVLILLDDFGWNGMSVQMDDRVPDSKSDFYQTPHLDGIAESGIRFTQGYSSSPICAPTRYAIQYGQSPSKLGRVSNFGHEAKKIDHGALWSLPKAVKAANPDYVTAHFGKWHIATMPALVGYDESDGITDNKEGFMTPGEAEHTVKYVMEDPKLSYSLSHRAADFISRQNENGSPFFLQVSYYANHTNVVCSPEEFARFSDLEPGEIHDNVHYAAMTADLDNGIGILMERIEQLGIHDETYVFVVADNGAIPGFPPIPNVERSFNHPLRMGKWDLNEGGIRVPFFVRGPGITSGTFNHTPVITHDLLPTIAALAGSEQPRQQGVEGIDLGAQLFHGSEDPDRLLVINFPLKTAWEMHDATTVVRKGKYKTIHYLEENRIELFDLENDISELNDLADSMPEKVQDMDAELESYFKGIGRVNVLVTRD
ncbi:sulfatase-like hydrolase/transferase [Pelagicoccus mobilis]